MDTGKSRIYELGNGTDDRTICDWLLPGLKVKIPATFDGSTGIETSTQTDHLLFVRVGSARFGARELARGSNSGDHKDWTVELVPGGIERPSQLLKELPVICFQFSPAQTRAVAVEMGLDPDRIELQPQLQTRDIQIEHIAAAIDCAVREAIPTDRSYRANLGIALLARTISRFGSTLTTAPSTGFSPKQLKSILDYIDKNIGKALSYHDLAALVNMSGSYFRALFQRAMGMPVHQYVIRKRIDKAKSLLEQGKTISEAAADTGFSDQSHLARSMRRVSGTLPFEVVRRARSAREPKPN